MSDKEKEDLENKIKEMKEHIVMLESTIEQVLEQMLALNKNFIELAEARQTPPIGGLFAGELPTLNN
jgi:prefoldin subunit 5